MTRRMDNWNPPESWKRITCIMMIRAGHQNNEIMYAAQCSLNTVKTIRNEVERSNEDYEAVATRKQHKRRSDCARSAEFLENLEQKVLEDPGIGIRALSRELNVSPSTMKHALNEDLRYYSYKRRKGQLLTEKTRQNRLTKAKKLLNKVKHPAEAQTIWFFSDEKNFCQDQKHNTQNNRWLAYNPKNIPRVMQTKFPQAVMVFGCVSSEGHVMPPHFFKEGLRLNSHGYVEMLTTVVKPWITRVANNRPFVWQQDSAPCHTSGKSQKWLSANFYDFTSPNVWPPNSPDLNPMDYYVWGTVEKGSNRCASTTKSQLIERIKAAFEALPCENVKSACSRFRGRIEAVIDANGGYFE